MRMVAYYREILLFTYGLCSIIGVCLIGVDKYLAVHNKWRISERTLLLFGFFGGIGVWMGMYIFHHKTKKIKFYLGVPLEILLYLTIFIVLTEVSYG